MDLLQEPFCSISFQLYCANSPPSQIDWWVAIFIPLPASFTNYSTELSRNLQLLLRKPTTHIKQERRVILSNMWLLLKCPVFIQPAVRLGLVSPTPELLPNLCENCIIESKIYSVKFKAELKLTVHYHPSQTYSFSNANTVIKWPK